MHSVPPCDENLERTLPLPLARLYRHAHNAKSPLDRHQAAYFLWEASLKLLGSTAIACYAEQPLPDPKLAERLTNLARPALGHWWEFVRLLVPALAETGDDGFRAIRDLLLGRPRDDLPRVAGLDASLRTALDGGTGSRNVVRLTELCDRLVRYRNRELGHGAAGQRSADFYDRVGRALLAGVPELLGQLDVLAGRRLVYVTETRQQSSGKWLIDRLELTGEAARRLDSLELPETEAMRLPRPERLYLEDAAATPSVPPRLIALHPLVVYDAESSEVLFLNARRGRQRSEYLCYSSGRVLELEDQGGEQRALLARVLNLPVDSEQMGQWVTRSQAEEEPATSAPTPARAIGEFELLSKLGQGGMGVVYRAWQPSLGRQVALKCLLRSGDAKAEARFAREIRALGRVEHPHLVKVFTSGSEGDQWFYAMELIEGATLAAVCDRLQNRAASPADVDLKTWQQTLSTVCEETRKAEKPLGPAAEESLRPSPSPTESLPLPPPGSSYVRHTVELIQQVAEAAHALHESGVIHRDIKPGNIMLGPDGGQAVLMDLGLAQLADETQGKLTRTRQFVGTLRYASPEQVLAVERLDRRSDVYSLGATLWELLTLKPLHGAIEEMPTPELMKRIQYTEPEGVRTHNPSVPADLETIVLKCLEKDAGRRYATAHDLADDLGRWLRGEPVQARRRTLRYVAGKYVRRHRRAIGIAAAVLLLQGLLLLGLFAFVDFGRKPEPPTDTAPPEKKERTEKIDLDQAPLGKGRALLVGCAHYDNLGEGYQLKGPGNDVELVRKLLVDQFQFAESEILTLTDEGDPDRRPTRANIERAIQHLAEVAERGERIVVYLSGSGGRQPIDPAGKHLESVFLPVDVSKQDKKTGLIQNSITGWDYALWAKPLLAKGALLWTICDCCYGGFASEEDWPAGATFVYAAQPNQVTTENRFPPGSTDARIQGVFTYSMCTILSHAKTARQTSLTCKELMDRIQSQYAAWGQAGPMPWVLARNRRDLLFEGRPRSELTLLQVYKQRGALRLNAGSLDGVTSGMILRVEPLHGQGAADETSHVRVKVVNDDYAVVEPCTYGGAAVPRSLPEPNRCQPVYIDYGEIRLKLGLASRTFEGEALSIEERQRWLKELEKPVLDNTRQVEWVRDPAQAGWLFQVRSLSAAELYLAPAAEVLARDQQIPTRGLQKELLSSWIGPLAAAKLGPALQEILPRLARSQNLLTLCDLLGVEQEGGSGPDVELRLIHYRDGSDQQGEVERRDRGITLNNDEVAFEVINHGTVAVDVTLLRIDATYGLVPLFPPPGTTLDNRLSPGKSLCTARGRPGAGPGTVIAVVVEAKGPPVDFTFLAQPTFDRARTEAANHGSFDRTQGSEFGRLLQNVLYGEGSTHGLDVGTIKQYALRKVSWRD